MEKIQFSFNGKCENLTYNMSYLTTIVHPLILIRLLEHRLFTPLLKKTNTRGGATSISMSAGANSISQQAQLTSFTSISNSTNNKIPSSTSFPSSQLTPATESVSSKTPSPIAPFRKGSDGFFSRTNQVQGNYEANNAARKSSSSSI